MEAAYVAAAPPPTLFPSMIYVVLLCTECLSSGVMMSLVGLPNGVLFTLKGHVRARECAWESVNVKVNL